MEQFQFLSALQNQNTGLVVVKSSIDGVERVYGLGRVGNTGYIVMVSSDDPLCVWLATADGIWSRWLDSRVLYDDGSPADRKEYRLAVRLLNFAAEEFGGNFSARAPTEGKTKCHGLA